MAGSVTAGWPLRDAHDASVGRAQAAPGARGTPFLAIATSLPAATSSTRRERWGFRFVNVDRVHGWCLGLVFSLLEPARAIERIQGCSLWVAALIVVL